MPINELRAIATFAKAVELGSLRKAAIALGLTPQAASQTLVQLEQHLGVRLLHRTTRNLALTDEGQQFLEAALPALATLERARQRLRTAKDEAVGPLRITSPRSTLLPVLMPLIEDYCQAHPDVQPDIQLDDRIGNWVSDRMDAGFRICREAEEGVIAKRLFPLQMIICATPDYLARHGAPASLDELTAHRCIGFRHPNTGLLVPWHITHDGVLSEHEIVPALSTNDADLEVASVSKGLAIGQLSGTSAAALIRAKSLVPLFTEHVSNYMGVYLYYGNRSQPARVRAFIDLAIQRLAGSDEFVLSPQELATAEAEGRKRAKTKSGSRT
jgi:DNA-binding transcriptional LysR family regulator